MSHHDDEIRDAREALRRKQQQRDEALIRKLRDLNERDKKNNPQNVQHIEVQSHGSAKSSSGCALILLATTGGTGALITLALTAKGWI